MIRSTGTRNVDRETVAVIQGRMMGIGCGVLGGSGKKREDWDISEDYAVRAVCRGRKAIPDPQLSGWK